MGMNVEEEIRGLGFMRRAVSIGGPFSSNYVSGIIVNIINHLEAGEISPIARVNSYSYIFLNILLGKIEEKLPVKYLGIPAKTGRLNK